MSDNNRTRYETSTRRDYLKYGGVVTGGVLAGCSGQSDPESTPSQTNMDDTPTATETATTMVLPEMVVYAAAKSALNSLTRTLAVELGSRGFE